jgi:uroporphyrinogen decarboxylase
MPMTREERVLRVIRRQGVDYLPSQITFSDRTRDQAISEALGLEGPGQLDDYLQNHIHISLSAHDKALFYRNDREEMARLKARGFCGMDWDNKVVYDAWGMGVRVGSDGFFACFHPLSKTATPNVAEHMPPDVNREVLFQDVEDAVAGYRVPDITRPHLFDGMVADLARYSGDYLVMPSGYFGTYERACGLMSFQEFMTNMALKPKVAHALLDKITEYKVAYAEKVVEMGFKVAHYGDDLGTQTGAFFSKRMFREFILPRIKRAWQPFNDAGIPIILHSCGCIADFIPDLLEIGLRVLEPCQTCMDPAYLKREFGKDLVFWGGIETQKLPFLTPEEVKAMVRESIRTLGRGGGHIIGPSQEVMNDVPLENVVALIETIVEERGQPNPEVE